ncbi:glycosyltransferase family 2 protein [Saccharibacillus kuerlensis]|uniref:Glycosyl transferase n=1 Tax=Saccharibacillus kuerlensis TaxID=459527 RepID=A0ABQ2KVR4_9BACL|nr:glycosyltransferase [Saccharibacillus kuerlensis]GGN94267.1 glycosyl transferase [Saccharibacillus kuerlensis]
MSDGLMLFVMLSIWAAVLQSIVFMAGAIRFLMKERKEKWDASQDMSHFPTVTVLIPAHNEELVIAATAENVLNLNYPPEKLQLIVIADNCSDTTANRLYRLKKMAPYQDRNFTVFERKGTGGKSGALNDALEQATGEWICIFDADAAPERNTLFFLITKALEDPERYGAVFGRNKARNRGQNLLSQFINLELVTVQRIYHTGMWQLFRIGTIPGTNFIIKSDLIREIGGWDVNALTEDTAVSFEIMQRGKLIALASRAEAYQQEPEDLNVYIKQRTRWAQGNFYVIMTNIKHLFNGSPWRVQLLVLYYAMGYLWFMLAILASDFILVINLIFVVLSLFDSSLTSPFRFAEDLYVYLMMSGALMYYLYVLQINLALASDIGQSTTRNFILSCLSYFTYSQLFIVLSLKAVWNLTVNKLTGRKTKWYKTQRFG